MPTRLIFDVDNTLTPPRRPVDPDMAAALGRLPVPFALAAGSNLDLVRAQLLDPLHGYGFRGEIDGFLCNGATRYRCRLGDAVEISVVREFNFREALGPGGLERLVHILQEILDEPRFALPDGVSIIGERIVDRGSMMNFAPIGRPREGTLPEAAMRNRDAFVAHDVASGYRAAMLATLKQRLAPLARTSDLVVTLGGQTSFDIVVRGNDKSYAPRTLLAEGATEIVYFGDALFEGGNDGAILDLIAAWATEHPGQPCPVKAVAVADQNDTRRHLRDLGFIV